MTDLLIVSAVGCVEWSDSFGFGCWRKSFLLIEYLIAS